jgi:ketosteroid isomerase-like protein
MTVHDNIAVVRTFTDGLRSGDIASCEALLDEANVFSEAPSLPFGGNYVGRDGFRAMLRDVGKTFRVALDPPEIVEAGERVLVRVHGTFTSRATGRSLPVDCIDLYELRDGRIVRVDVFYKDSHAVTELCTPQPPTTEASRQ